MDQGFFRRFAGELAPASANLKIRLVPEIAGEVISLLIENDASTLTNVTVANQYTAVSEHFALAPGARVSVPIQLVTTFRWYDLLITASGDTSFVRHYAGHIENGLDSLSDPHIGADAEERPEAPDLPTSSMSGMASICTL